MSKPKSETVRVNVPERVAALLEGLPEHLRGLAWEAHQAADLNAMCAQAVERLAGIYSVGTDEEARQGEWDLMTLVVAKAMKNLDDGSWGETTNDEIPF